MEGTFTPSYRVKVPFMRRGGVGHAAATRTDW
jgi:hypothetical protein